MAEVKAAGPRERLLVAAQDLFYTRGAGVGVEALLKEANVARRSLYEHFGGKDGLVTEVLRRASEEDIACTSPRSPVPKSRVIGCSGCSTGWMNSFRTKASGAAATSPPISRSPSPTIRPMRRPSRSAAACTPSWPVSSRRWAIRTPGRQPSSCTC